MLGAADTFRAAAQEQLTTWAERIEVPIVTGQMNADPASVAYDSVSSTVKRKIDVSIIDTAGRLQNKKNLMDEFKKIANVIKKSNPESPQEIILVLDATSGQNILNQIEEFNKIIPLTGLIMTKLDGTAKGGILLALAKKYKIPIIALGLGEKEDDLEIFDSESFASAFVRTN